LRDRIVSHVGNAIAGCDGDGLHKVFVVARHILKGQRQDINFRDGFTIFQADHCEVFGRNVRQVGFGFEQSFDGNTQWRFVDRCQLSAP
jgi:hypothetical protein